MEILGVLRDIHDACQRWLRDLEKYMVENDDFRAELLKIDDALRVASQYSHYMLKKYRIPHYGFNP